MNWEQETHAMKEQLDIYISLDVLPQSCPTVSFYHALQKASSILLETFITFGFSQSPACTYRSNPPSTQTLVNIRGYICSISFTLASALPVGSYGVRVFPCVSDIVIRCIWHWERVRNKQRVRHRAREREREREPEQEVKRESARERERGRERERKRESERGRERQKAQTQRHAVNSRDKALEKVYLRLVGKNR